MSPELVSHRNSLQGVSQIYLKILTGDQGRGPGDRGGGATQFGGGWGKCGATPAIGEGGGTGFIIRNCGFFHFGGIFGLRDPSWRILRKISVPNAPFSWRLVHPHSVTVVRKIFTQLFDEFQGAVFEICLRLRTFTNLQSS